MDHQDGPAAGVSPAAVLRRRQTRPTLTFTAFRRFIVVFGLSLAVLSASAQQRTVTDQAGFYAALSDASVTVIQLSKNVIISTKKGAGSWPIVLGRTVLLEGDGSYPTLDLNFASNDRVVLGPGVTLTFRRLVVSNIFSRNQLACDFFAPSPASSTIEWDNVVDSRSLCQPLEFIHSAWMVATRPADSGGTVQLQVVASEPICSGSGACLVRSVMRSTDVVVDSPSGYRIRLNNTLTVCDEFISQACIDDKGVDLCFLNGIEDLMARKSLLSSSMQADTAGEDSSSSSGAQAGIIAGCVVGGVVLMALLFGCVVYRRRRAAARESKAAIYTDNSLAAAGPESEAGTQAFGSTGGGVGDSGAAVVAAAAANIPLAKLPSSKVVQRAAEGRFSHDTSNSTDVRPSPGGPGVAAAAALGSGSSLRVSPPGAPRPSGSGARDVVSGSSLATSQQPQQQPQQQQHNQVSASGHSVTSVVVALLRSMISRGSNSDQRGAQASLAPSIVAAPRGMSVTMMSHGSAATQGGGPSGARGGTSPAASAAVPRRASLRMANESGRGSSGGQVSVASGRPSMCEMQQELDRIEGQLVKESRNVKAGRSSRSVGGAARHQ